MGDGGWCSITRLMIESIDVGGTLYIKTQVEKPKYVQCGLSKIKSGFPNEWGECYKTD
jgi:hypothetical protein